MCSNQELMKTALKTTEKIEAIFQRTKILAMDPACKRGGDYHPKKIY